MASSVRMMAQTSSARLPALFAMAMSGTEMTATADPPRMKGVRRPSLEVQRSDRMPKSGSKNSPKTLSMAMMAPVSELDRPKVLVSILGTMPS